MRTERVTSSLPKPRDSHPWVSSRVVYRDELNPVPSLPSSEEKARVRGVIAAGASHVHSRRKQRAFSVKCAVRSARPPHPDPLPRGRGRGDRTLGTCIVGLIAALSVIVLATAATAQETVAPPAPAKPEILDSSKFYLAGFVAFACGAVILCTELARRGRPVYVRPIAGLKVIDEAVGRSTEMGRPMLFIPGIMDLDQIETVAGLTVMSQIAKKAAEYDTPLEVPTARVLVMSAAREMCQAAALAAGRPETYDSDRINYITDDQFGYVAHVVGWMVREKPAACFFLGKFFAESLILAETGQSVGAIQVGGTAEAAQLPFFVAACDYALIGEELFAASAYLSGEPQQLGTVQGQDWGKFLAIGLIVIGCLLATAVSLTSDETLAAVLHALKDQILSTGGGE